MNTLPINTIIAPAQTSNKPASNDDAAPQGAQGFGNVLARHVADSSSSSEKNAGQDAKDTNDVKDTKDAKDVQGGKDAKDSGTSPPATDKEAKDTAVLPDITSLLPADMMAALLAQQNPDTTKTAAPLPSAVDKPIQGNTPEISLAIASGKGDNTPRTDLSATTTRVQAATPELDTDRPDAPATAANNKQNFADTLKATGKNELASTLTGESPHKQRITELAATAQQPVIAAASQAPASNTPVMAAAALSSQLTVNTPVNQAGWGNEFSQKITWLATQRDQSAELHLNPPQLGPLDVVIKVSADQATALFTSPHAAVREAIEQALPKLREMLADNGIMLGNATVSDQASQRDQNDFARAQQGSGTGSGHTEDVTPAISRGERVTSLPRHNGMVDTFA